MMERQEKKPQPLHLEKPPPGSKIQGRIVDGAHAGEAFYVYNPEDWKIIRSADPDTRKRPRIKCRERACPAELVSNENKKGTHWLSNKVGSAGCGHDQIPPEGQGGGGLESPEHIWMKGRLHRVISLIGDDPIIEHQPTHADVYAQKAKVALEYQRWDTEFLGRQKAREDKGARVVWIFPHTPPTHSAQRALERATKLYPCLWIRVVDRENWNVQLEPWNYPEQERRAILVIAGPFLRKNRTTGKSFVSNSEHHAVDALLVLKKIFGGTYRWVPPETLTSRGIQSIGAWERLDGKKPGALSGKSNASDAIGTEQESQLRQSPNPPNQHGDNEELRRKPQGDDSPKAAESTETPNTSDDGQVPMRDSGQPDRPKNPKPQVDMPEAEEANPDTPQEPPTVSRFQPRQEPRLSELRGPTIRWKWLQKLIDFISR